MVRSTDSTCGGVMPGKKGGALMWIGYVHISWRESRIAPNEPNK